MKLGRDVCAGEPVFRLLGPVTVMVDGCPLPVGPPQRRAVLAVLLLCEPGRVVTVERLVEQMWGGDSPKAARKIVQGHVCRLRGALRDVPGVELATEGQGYVLSVDREQIDVHRFRRLIGDGQFAEALSLWRGVPFSEIGQAAFAGRFRALLVEERLMALENRVAADLAAGRLDGLVRELEAVLAERPLRERCYELLMRVLLRTGREDEARAVFDRASQVLAEELGTGPSSQLRTLRHSRGGVVPGQLPRDLPDFVGREAELAEHEAVLRAAGPSVSALVGQSGVGKTALAVHVAHRARCCHPGGQLFADLQGSRSRPVDPGVALAGFLLALGMPADGIPRAITDRAALFQDMVRGRGILVLIDDAADAAHVRPLLPASGDASVLITSRDCLRDLPVQHRTVLRPLGRAPAFELFDHLVGRAGLDTETVGRAVDLSGGVPSSIRSTASRLARRTHWSADDVAASLSRDWS